MCIEFICSASKSHLEYVQSGPVTIRWTNSKRRLHLSSDKSAFISLHFNYYTRWFTCKTSSDIIFASVYNLRGAMFGHIKHGRRFFFWSKSHQNSWNNKQNRNNQKTIQKLPKDFGCYFFVPFLIFTDSVCIYADSSNWSFGLTDISFCQPTTKAFTINVWMSVQQQKIDPIFFFWELRAETRSRELCIGSSSNSEKKRERKRHKHQHFSILS